MDSHDVFPDLDGDRIVSLKPVIHVTHRNSDPDSFAGVLWGSRVLGGCSLVHNPSRIVRNLLKVVNFRERTCWNFKRVFAYDVNSPDKLPINPVENLVVIDHHPKNSFRDVTLVWKPRASLAMNLYDISAGINLPDEVLFSFAVALVTDTAILRTASSEELYYLSRFMKGRRLEDVFKVIFKGSVKMEEFLKDLESIAINGPLCFGKFSNEDHFMFFCDTLMYSLGCEIVVGELEWGIWMYAEKGMVQELFRVLKVLERDYKRVGGKLIGADLHTVLKRLTDLLPLSADIRGLSEPPP